MPRVNKKRAGFYIAVIGLLIFLSALGVWRPFGNLIRLALSPIANTMHTLGTKFNLSYDKQSGEKDWQSEAEKLKEELAELTIANARLETAEHENELLRESLAFLKQNNLKYIVSNVISRGEIIESSGQTETIVIDKGSQAGVRAGLAVVNSEGIVVGKVAEVKDNIAKVYLTSNKKCKIAATVLNQQKTAGVTEGELGLTIKMDLIPQSEAIAIGDTIVTSGLEETIPRGLVIGRVIEVTKENNDLWQSAQIESLIDINNLIIVSVVVP